MISEVYLYLSSTRILTLSIEVTLMFSWPPYNIYFFYIPSLQNTVLQFQYIIRLPYFVGYFDMHIWYISYYESKYILLIPADIHTHPPTHPVQIGLRAP